jgi:hypothetical protein
VNSNGLVLLLLVGALVLGCGGGAAAPERGKLEGTVSVNGKPVNKGLIRFMALDPSGLNVVAEVSEGKFSVPATEGPTKGNYRVEFSVPSDTKKRIPNDDIPGQFIEEAPETLPAKYHRDSAIVQEYDPANTQPLSFDLKTP